MKPCPTECGKSVRPGNLMCIWCWRLVPKPLQDDVWRTWHRYQRRPPGAGRLGFFRVYRAAADAAIAAARERLIKKALAG